MVLVLVRETFLQMPQYYFKALGIQGNEESRREGQYRGSLNKNFVFRRGGGGGGGGLRNYTGIITGSKYIIQRYTLSDDDMIYTYVNMYMLATDTRSNNESRTKHFGQAQIWRTGRHTSAKNF